MTALRYFKVPVEEAFEPARPICRDWAEEVLESLGDEVYGSRVDEVENKFRDGFIPYTEGGVEGIGYGELSYAHSSGCAPAVIQPYVDQSVKDAEEEWDRQNPEHSISWLYAKDDEDQGDLLGKSREREHWKEKWYEFEDEWLREGGTYFYKVRCLYFAPGNRHNESGEPEIFFMVGINTDFEYGRDSIPWLRCYGSEPNQNEWVWEAAVKAKDLTPELGEQLAQAAIKQLRAA